MISEIGSLKKYIAKINFYGLLILEKIIYWGGKLIGRFIFTFKLFRNPGFFTNQQSYFPELASRGKWFIFFDLLWYVLKTGELNKNYFLFGFDVKTKKEKKEYVSWLKFTHARDKKNQSAQRPEYDPFNFVCLLRDKFVFEAFCKGAGIATPSNLALINKGEVLFNRENRFVTLEKILEHDIDAFCKRNVGYGGGMSQDVLKLQIINKEIFVNSEPCQYQDFQKLVGQGNWIIQNRIINQDPVFAKFHPGSVNTIRIVTINTHSSVEVLCALQRMGAHGRHADNWSTGGIIAGIDVKSGKLEKWGFYRPGFGTKTDSHPNTGVAFEEIELPQWKLIIDFVKNAHKKFYGIYSIGWDVCMTNDGPLLIEGNDNWETLFVQLYKGARTDFNKYFRK